MQTKHIAVQASHVGIGWRYENDEWLEPVVIETNTDETV